MKYAAVALQNALYLGNVYAVAECYRIVFADGVTPLLRLSGTMSDLKFSGFTYLGGVVIKRGTVRTTARLEVATMEVTFIGGDYLVGGVPIAQAIRQGVFDDALIECIATYWDAGGAYIGRQTVFQGTVDEPKPGSMESVLTVKSAVSRFTVKLPRRFIQPSCPYTVYEPNTCMVSPAGFTDTAPLVATGTTTSLLKLDRDCAMAVAGSMVTFQSGAVRVASRVTDPRTIYLGRPLSAVPALGSTLSIQRGCAKTKTDCAVFSNLLRFGGFPDAPPNAP